MWQQHFGGAADLIGNTIKLEGTAYTVVGIMPPNHHVSFEPGNSQYWISYLFPGEELARGWEPEGNPTWRVIGRLRKGVARQELQTVLDTVAARWLRDLHQPNQRWKFQVNPAREDFINPKVEKTLWSLQAMAGALLFIGCANVGNLLLSRAFSRRGEFGIRMAIGAGRWRIARQLFVESLSLAGLAAALGVFLAWGGIIAQEQFYLPQLGYLSLLGPSNVIGVDWRVLGTTCLVAAAAGVFFGAAPAWLAARVNVNESLKDAAQQQSGGYLQRMFHDGAQLYRSTAPRRVMMWLLITLGCLGLLMSALGVYAVMAYSVVRRTREIGIRMAMGAGRSQIRNLFVGHGARLIANGIGLGVALAITAGHYMQSLLFGVSPADPLAFASILLTLGVAAGIACWLPARRAARVDPMEALRYE